MIFIDTLKPKSSKIYLQQFWLLVLLHLMSANSSFAQKDLAMGQWRTHLPYLNVTQIAESNERIYVVAEKGMYSFEKQSGEIEVYSKVTGLSETQVQCIAYSQKHKALVVAYQNANVDIIINKKIINLPGILRKSLAGVKSINSITLEGDLAYLACSFGIVVINLNTLEIADSYERLNPTNGDILDINKIAILNGQIYAATPIGIIRSFGQNLKDFASWELHKNVPTGISLISSYQQNIYYVDNQTIYKGNNNQYNVIELAGSTVYSMETCNEKLVICKEQGISIWNDGFKEREVNENFRNFAWLDNRGVIVCGNRGSGMVFINPDNSYNFLSPSGPSSFTSFDVASVNDQVWITSGGLTSQGGPTFNNAGFYRFIDGRWYNRNAFGGIPRLDSMFDFTTIAVSKNQSDVYIGSHGTGVAHFVNGQYRNRFDPTNSPLERGGGFFVQCLGLDFDSKQNLWITNVGAAKPLKVKKADGKWNEYLLNGISLVGKIVVDDHDQKWIIVNQSGKGIVVFKENENGNGYKIRELGIGNGKGGLPNNNITVLKKDQDGEIWIGTQEGLAVVYNPSLVFDGGNDADAQQIIIDDGKDVGYLLGNQVINDIEIDGANRKWIATNNGAWLVAADGRSVIRNFTTTNSPLLSDIVNTVAVNPISGEVFLGTQEGVISFRGDATETGEFHKNTLVFPNPVHPHYEGPITITGLPRNATVKITDIAGRMVYETIATGGTAVWDGRNFAGEKPQTGVYLIFSANVDDEDALVSKLLYVR